ncbi:MAG: hypothetical protein HYY16_00415 [Planctomycetes bacterium]|nr:hypothetical protein [Planctomycetota bacterium]
MDYSALEEAVEACRAGVRHSLGLEVSPLPKNAEGLAHLELKRDGQIVSILATRWPEIAALAFSDDGTIVAAAGSRQGVGVWRADTGELLAQRDEPASWIMEDGKPCLPLRFTASRHLLLAGGRQLFLIESSLWSPVPVVAAPVIAILPEAAPEKVLIVGPEEDGVFPIECLSLDSLTLSHHGMIFRDQTTTTIAL